MVESGIQSGLDLFVVFQYQRESNMVKSTNQFIGGVGLALRKEHYQAILTSRPAVDWFEALSENYMVDGGRPLHVLESIRADYPLVLHGVSLSIGGSAPLAHDYLQRLRALGKRFEPAWISDHLCWTGHEGRNLHDLMPLPFTDGCLHHVADRIRQVQDYLGQQILLENVSSYVAYPHSTMHEADFLAELCKTTDCLLLLDINNVFVSATNHGFDPYDYLWRLPAERVRQIHLAGHSSAGEILIDTHDQSIADPVWALYAEAVDRFGPVPAMIERDDRIPPLDELLVDLDQVRAIQREASASPVRRWLA